MIEENRKAGGPGGPMKTEVREISDGIYDIAGGFHQYFIVGEDKVLLIDTGMGLESPRKYVEQITDLPIVLVNTHGHPDHAGGRSSCHTEPHRCTPHAQSRKVCVHPVQPLLAAVPAPHARSSAGAA